MKRCVPHRTDTLLGSYLFEPTCLFVETLPRLFILSFFPFLIHTKTFASLHCISFIFVRLFCKLSSSGSSDPYHFGGMRSVLSWETIIHYPRYKLRGQIRLKDTTLSLGSGQHSHLFVFLLLLQVCFFYFWFFNEHRNNTLKTNFLFFFVSVSFVFTAVSELIFFSDCSFFSLGFKFFIDCCLSVLRFLNSIFL